MSMRMTTRIADRTLGAVGALVLAAGCGSDVMMDESPPLETASEALTAKARGSDQESLRRAFPKARVDMRGGRIARLSHAALAKGATPEASTETFRSDMAARFGSTADELVPARLEHGRHVYTARPEGEPFMHDPKTGAHKLTMFRYAQVRSGLPVYGASLRVIVSNATGNPVISADSTLRDLGDFVVPSGVRAFEVDARRSLAAVATDPGALADGRKPPSELSFTKPELVIYAGAGEEVVAPRLAAKYVGSGDAGVWRFLADASTGDIIRVDSAIHSARVRGYVNGMGTDGHVASECAGTTGRSMKHAYVRLSSGAEGFTDELGNYELSGPAYLWWILQSEMRGRAFTVVDNARSTETLEKWVYPPATSNFLHNASSNNEYLLAEVNGYYFANKLRDWVLSYEPAFPVIATETGFPVRVNATDGLCPGNGEYEDEPDPRYYGIKLCAAGARDGTEYTNTAFGSAIYHEYGHHIVKSATGIQYRSSYAEGMADAIALAMTDDSRVGAGLVKGDCNSSWRDIDVGNDCTAVYPEGGPCSTCGDAWVGFHECGMVLSGAIVGIRKRLMATHPNYRDIVNRLILRALRYHNDNPYIPATTLDEFLMADDDDNNLANGTPHWNAICESFAERNIATCPTLSSPCAQFCSNPLTIGWSGSYQSGSLGTGTICRETTQAVTGGNCGGLASGRKLYINGMEMNCNYQTWSPVPPRANGGYCITTTAGNNSWASFSLW